MSGRSESPEYQRVLNAALDAALDHRVRLHRERTAHLLSIPDYLAGLEAVRNVEALIEPLRGADHSRAYELIMIERQATA